MWDETGCTMLDVPDAAARGGIKTVLIPEENEKDLVEIPVEITKNLKIIPVRWIDKVLETALERKPVPMVETVDVPVIATVAKEVAPVVTKH